MLVKETYADVTTTVDGAQSPMRIFVFHPTIPQYPNAYVSSHLSLSLSYRESAAV